jgi:ribosome recycling factor
MDGALQALQRDLHGVRTGRASTGLVESIRVDYYGSEMPLDQLAQISVGDGRMIMIQPYDKTAVQSIVKAIQTSDLGMNPNVDGDLIRLNVPPLTEERRRDIVRMVRKRAEEARVAVRNVRRDAQDRIRNMQKGSEISEDESRRALADLQKATDAAVARVDSSTGAKEKEVMQV